MTVRVVTDSACDLPDTAVAAHGIEVVPLTIRSATRSWSTGATSPRRSSGPAAPARRCCPRPPPPTPGAFEAAFRRAAEDGCAGVVCVTLSAALSGTFQSPRLAAAAVSADIPVMVVDSRSVTMGQGQMCLAAAARARRARPSTRSPGRRRR